ncbi:RNA 2',3'-cyclic phosphodiesterase [Candidatus Binatus soli]|jgi:2'-5' RNA ligase|uniref:RNA 2',3'-cyclic phosphodiesterase n=1 Tax=Candidatus Binatus soli TaxID=1953413 RepID=UPI003D144DE9
MTHWVEGQARAHLHDDFVDREARGVRAFVAVRMNEQVEESVAETIGDLKHPRDGVRWVPRANLHITLKFLGPAVDSHRLERLTAGLHQLATKTAPFEVAAAGVGAFPDLERPRTIWVGLHSVEPGALAALAARLETVAADYGFEREKRRWSGHLTIGRVGDQPVAGKTRQALYAARDREFGVSRIESITLYRSHLGPDGSSYEALATFLFQAR